MIWLFSKKEKGQVWFELARVHSIGCIVFFSALISGSDST